MLVKRCIWGLMFAISIDDKIQWKLSYFMVFIFLILSSNSSSPFFYSLIAFTIKTSYRLKWLNSLWLSLLNICCLHLLGDSGKNLAKSYLVPFLCLLENHAFLPRFRYLFLVLSFLLNLLLPASLVSLLMAALFCLGFLDACNYICRLDHYLIFDMIFF